MGEPGGRDVSREWYTEPRTSSPPSTKPSTSPSQHTLVEEVGNTHLELVMVEELDVFGEDVRTQRPETDLCIRIVVEAGTEGTTLRPRPTDHRRAKGNGIPDP
jgi:hypothetical protein